LIILFKFNQEFYYVSPEQQGPFVNHRKTRKSLIVTKNLNSSLLVNLQKTIKNVVVAAQFGVRKKSL